ncbi:unnamed protein product [Arabidopsis thaliana]|uniref:(thale cress) hypothetical protein n=1 Tax=Arabidopsis thaliana TaxID=3702 RepID=A0A7G2EW35_ARATH|nr:unnamed protein product [Arabidopsis thaliana]
MLCRGLYTRKKHEIWFVFAGQPFRFLLREFAILTGLNCGPYPSRRDILKSQQPINLRHPYWNVLIGKEHKVVLIKDIFKWLKTDKLKPKEERMEPWRRLCLAVIVIVEGILICSSQPVKVSKQVIEMVKDLEAFEAYPWGRESFLLTKLDPRYLPNPDDTQTISETSLTSLPPLKTYHNSNIMETELIPGLSISPLLPIDDPPYPNINDYWIDEVEDPTLDYMERVIGKEGASTQTIGYP